MSYCSLYNLPYLRNGFNCSSYPFCSLYHQRFFPVYQYIRYDRNCYTNNKQFNKGKCYAKDANRNAFPERVRIKNRVVEAIRPHISAKHALPGGHVNVCGNKAADLGVIIPCHQVIQPGFGVVIVASVTEGIVRAQ